MSKRRYRDRSFNIHDQIAIFCGAKYPRKMKKQINGTRSRRRKMDREFADAFKKPLVVNVSFEIVEL